MNLLNTKKTMLSLAVLLAVVLSPAAGFAAEGSSDVGVIDYQELMVGYAKAKDFFTKDQTKRKELKDLRDRLAEELKKGEKLSPVEQKVLEDKLNTQFSAKLKEYKDWAVAEDTTIQKSIDTAIDTVSKENNLRMILVKPAVVVGGKDVTKDVLTKLNK
jgi:outer membrane protein